MKNPMILTLAAAALTGLARAEEPPPPDLLMAQALGLPETLLPPGFGDAAPERVVKGAPYCADAVHETVQWLPDPNGGAPNRIVRQHSTRLCRDGEGRTRQETERNGRKLVYLRDPVAGEVWQLDPAAKTARSLRTGVRGGESLLDSAAWRDYGERMREWSRNFSQRWGGSGRAASGAVPPIPPVPPMPPTPALLLGGEREIQIVRIDGSGGDLPVPPTPPIPPEPPAVSLRALELAPRGAGTVTPLGSKDIDGLRANGERTTWTIEAGKVGNEKPIVIVREVWTAPDLALTLRSRDFDPRSTEVLYRLQNLRRGEPDAALMRVPADYSVRKPAAKASSATG